MVVDHCGQPRPDHLAARIPDEHVELGVIGLPDCIRVDPVNFHHDLKVTIQDLGWLPSGKYQQLSDDIASTAFWYQKEPHAPFPAFPVLLDRWPR